MSNSITPYKKLTGGGRCKALLTLVMLMLLTLATSARAMADTDREAYAVFDNGTLTFYCDNQKTTHSGAMNLNEGYTVPDWNNNASGIFTVEFTESFQDARPTTCFDWFYLCTNLTEIKGIQYLNTSEVTDMSNMFSGCETLESLDLSGFNTEKVTDMSFMFRNCKAIKSLDLSSFNTARVANMEYMFNFCSALESLDLSSFNTSGVTKMSDMFAKCSVLTTLDLSRFNTSMVKGMENMFFSCSALETILVGSGWNVDKVTSSAQMFFLCTNLIGGKGFKCSGISVDKEYARIDDNPRYPGYLTSLKQCTPYAELIDNPDGETKTLVFRFSYKPNNAMSLKEDFVTPEWTQYASKITTVEFDPLFKYAQPKTCSYWFYQCTNLTEIKGIQYLNTSEVTNMNYMFYGCESLKSLDLSSFNTDKVLNLVEMFYGCETLESLDLSSFNTSRVDCMGNMFSYCSALKSLDVSSFNTSGVEEMWDMFPICSALKTILVGSGWNVDKVTFSDNMFYGCENLTGGNGTTYTYDNPTDKTYAVIDGKDGKPGYLTLNALTLTKTNGSTTAVLNGDFADGSGAALIIDKEIKVDALTFNRKFTNGVTATVMFPFGFTAGNNIKGTFHTITKVGPDNNGVWTAELSEAITDIKANTPYIFYPTADIDAITFSNITLVPTNGTLTNGDANGWQLHGVYSKKIWPEDSKTEYGFAAVKVEEDNIEAGEFVLAGKDAWADPMRCYLTYAGSGKPFTAKAATVLPDRIRVVFPSDNDDEITTDPAEVITPVSSVSETDEIKVWSFGGTVYIESQPDMDYTIVDLNGRTIKTGITHSTREDVTLSRHTGIVIVNINGKSVKVNL
ncbi:MAG: BspA family leucine-rich repeat surface protein [Bacteroidales bacterium]|nr:BspA family leucine-rich repeat surface protein [Bacteroidales bacterium]